MVAQTQKKTQKGFTLIELLVVIGILAVLLSLVLIAINPARQFAQANNTKRSADVNSILNAIHQYMADTSGTPPANITTSVQTITNSTADICSQLVTRYLAALPQDPGSNGGAPISSCAGAYNTGYTVVQSPTDNRITVAAPGVQLGATISVTR